MRLFNVIFTNIPFLISGIQCDQFSGLNEGDQITITGTASDNVGVVKIELYLYKQGQPVGNPIKTCPNTTSCSNYVGYKKAGDYVAGIKAFDGAGNYNTRSTIFTVLVELY